MLAAYIDRCPPPTTSPHTPWPTTANTAVASLSVVICSDAIMVCGEETPKDLKVLSYRGWWCLPEIGLYKNTKYDHNNHNHSLSPHPFFPSCACNFKRSKSQRKSCSSWFVDGSSEATEEEGLTGPPAQWSPKTEELLKSCHQQRVGGKLWTSRGSGELSPVQAEGGKISIKKNKKFQEFQEYPLDLQFLPVCEVWYIGWVTREKVIIIIINTTTEVIIYRVLTTFRHGIKCFIGLLGKARRHGTIAKTVDSGDSLPSRVSALLHCLGRWAASSLAVLAFPSVRWG